MGEGGGEIVGGEAGDRGEGAGEGRRGMVAEQLGERHLRRLGLGERGLEGGGLGQLEADPQAEPDQHHVDREGT